MGPSVSITKITGFDLPSDFNLDLFEEQSIESIISLPEPYTQGSIRTLAPQPNIGFSILRQGPQRDLLLMKSSTRDKGTLALYYDIEREASCIWVEGMKRSMQRSYSGMSYILSPSATLVHEAAPCASRHTLVLHLNMNILGEFLGAASSSSAMYRLLGEPGGEPSLALFPIDSKSAAILSQVEHCPYSGVVQKIYLEGKAYELLALAFHSLLRKKEDPPSIGTSQTIKRMAKVKEIIDSSYRQTISLSDIARTIGISVSTLKRDFQMTYGMSVHTCLINTRLRVVSELLDERYLSLKEAAFIAGYKSPTHFARLYAKYYGQFPSDN
jgi:AraC-like DNA-binding protein